jgi:hypothetical protein
MLQQGSKFVVKTVRQKGRRPSQMRRVAPPKHSALKNAGEKQMG